ncbi:septation ring formation regulator EzrA [Virgibacillus soli]|uniref:Septation ring formation regulator EzrA n=1 Tax=Paracerasibacillus soli TaxID=480284 RepID=A0ABU5CQQ2_9BACI|nr:septation ring formation regulator EzrA [Virgibacillus soli]MDY0408676.1 septation ring formation regulator EzrA [Virgibacillus soli]
MEFIIGGILVIIAILIAGLIFRKRIYDEVDQLDNRKMEIVNRNVASEIARIKKLNLSGETQDKFEMWKDKWETIVTNELPNLEEQLFDAEEAADRYRFPTAKKLLQKIASTLKEIEQDIDTIIAELDELIDTEKTSRMEVEQIVPELSQLKKQLTQQFYQYGKAGNKFEANIKTLEERTNYYFELVNTGNYLAAKEHVEEVKVDFEKLKESFEEYPSIFKACSHHLPSELDELSNGLHSMKEDGYRVEHLGFEKEIQQYKQRLQDCEKELEQAEIKEAKKVVAELEIRIKEMYQLLEKEALAKNYVDSHVKSYESALSETASTLESTRLEVDEIKQTYYLDDMDMEKYLSLDKAITQLQNQFSELTRNLTDDQTAHSTLREQLESGFKQIEELRARHEEFKEGLLNLRQDEIKAKAQLSEMREQLQSTYRKLKKSNIPGIPEFILNIMENAQEKNQYVFQVLEKKPLDIAEVQQALNEAKLMIDQLIEQTDFMLDQAYFTEHVIQYANRYRSKDPVLAAKLAESERLFRTYEYESALEEAVKAVEEVEPGAIKKIEQMQEIL